MDCGTTDAGSGPGDGDGDGSTAATAPPTMRRLTRAEYDNTLRDLLGDTSHPSRSFSPDPIAYLFQNNAEAQTLARLDVERYLSATETVVETAWTRRSTPPTSFAITRFDGAMNTAPPDAAAGFAWQVDIGHPATVPLQVTVPGQVAFSLRLKLTAPAVGPLDFVISQDGAILATVDVSGASAQAIDAQVVLPVTWDANNSASLLFTVDPRAGTYPGQVLFSVGNAVVPYLRDDQRLAACDPAAIGVQACARSILTPFATRAWRRPATPAEIDPLIGLVDTMAAGDTFDDVMKLALEAVLLSPRFLFLTETDPDPNATAPHPITAYELAARLSYFLWSSLPDRALSDAADSGRILAPQEIAAQVHRMVADVRFQGFIDNFAGYWLSFTPIAAISDSAAARDLGVPLDLTYASMRTESARFTTQVFQSNLPLSEVLSADYTYIDTHLAELYGLPQVPLGFQRTSLVGVPRRGILTQGSVLTATSPVAQVTEPTIRGKFILGRLFCQDPPPPPADVIIDNFAMNQPLSGGQSLRQRLDAHRANPDCASCHASMDPLGFAFENYDTQGRWRSQAYGLPVDATGSVAGLGAFGNALDLIALVNRDGRVAPCVARQVMTYALGNGPLDADADGITAVAHGFDAAHHGMLDLIVLVATSPRFATRTPTGTH